ncbi:DUF1080 domain-containing protein [Saccharobesus litoralis]|uniref:DUF1080 domain-containing protein n=2 Tax=Saccharobesus litoralis TaxID=2172099 RepID=A0A2S0VNL6_9ALTE|nr:DUF1080 domain-containing protein [Saccharobesus litoralis]
MNNAKYRATKTLQIASLSGLLAIVSLMTGPVQAASQDKIPGYTNTPLVPGTKWHVHDPNRPQPKIVTTAGPISQPPPSDAIVLFDGQSMDAFARSWGNKNPVEWLIKDGVVTIQKDPKTGKNQSIRTKQSFGDMQLHVEWRSPAQLEKHPPARGNSGLFLMGRYELQIMQSHNNKNYPDGQAAAVYGQTPPLVNASRPADEWNSYDIVFEAPEFDKEGNVLKKAHVTVFHNGVLVQLRTPILGPTRHKKTTPYKAHKAKEPLVIQDHGSPVSFRNIWVRELDLTRP